MIIGNPSVLAIESGITRAYERLSFRALGYFVVYVGGRCYGKQSPESTMLSCSYDEVKRRIAMRGRHTAPLLATESDAGKVADAFRGALYGGMPQEGYFGLPQAQFSEMIDSKRIVWCPDGDEAFDDGSYVLQLDVGRRVRLIAFKSGQGRLHDPGTLSDVWLAADDFYAVLRCWSEAFDEEWVATPKCAE